MGLTRSGVGKIDASAMSNAQVAALMHRGAGGPPCALTAVTDVLSDELAVLIELDGHTARNRMEITALHPAPVQV
jgi:predicted O-linked N-acetylglucosamine transferase (SPINDLY family)